MTELLDFAVQAHGGLDAWNRYSRLRAELSVAGAIWTFKRNPGLLTDIVLEAGTHEERVVIRPFGGPGLRSVFVPEKLTLEREDGTVADSRKQPRSAFAGHVQETPWDNFHVAYFSSYALWTYLCTPFLYTYPGFSTEEIEPWQENGETWRRLKVTFPSTGIASHAHEQVTHFGPDGLVRRHDYTVDVLGGATGANYAFDYREFDGIMVPTTRRIYAYDEQGHKIPEPLLVSIDIASVAFE